MSKWDAHPLARPIYALAAALVLSACVISCGNHYVPMTTASQVTYVLDSWTGETKMIAGQQSYPVTPSPEQP